MLNVANPFSIASGKLYLFVPVAYYCTTNVFCRWTLPRFAHRVDRDVPVATITVFTCTVYCYP